MNSEIKRIGWHGVHGMQDDANGDYVLHSDHEAEIARLRAEVEGLRNALEKIASIRLNDHASIDAAYGHACSIANEAIFDHSDAAMGASA
ncbi:TPA: hypothetical protein ACGCGJ_000435 [Stenotrophomonas maltophilia]